MLHVEPRRNKIVPRRNKSRFKPHPPTDFLWFRSIKQGLWSLVEANVVSPPRKQ